MEVNAEQFVQQKVSQSLPFYGFIPVSACYLYGFRVCSAQTTTAITNDSVVCINVR